MVGLLRRRRLVRRYEDELGLFRSGWAKVGLAAFVAGIALFPQLVTGDFWLSVANYAGIFAIGAIGLNLLTGFTGQVSLGHSFFLGIGAYTTVILGVHHGLPLPLWLLGAAVVGGLIGLVIGPFALRLRGNYLAVISLGLVFLGLHWFRNWQSVTGGGNGVGVTPPLTLGPIDFGGLHLFGYSFSRNQSFFYLVWPLVALVLLLTKNIVRTRPGRAMQAVRDRDVAAEVIGVSVARYKVGAFVVSSAFAALAGALYGAFQQYVAPTSWDLFLAIQFIAMIIVGGVGTVFGSVLGAIFLVTIPELIRTNSDKIPGVAQTAGDGLTVFQLNQMIFGALIVLFLVLEPRGLAALWLRFKAYLKAWPFSY